MIVPVLSVARAIGRLLLLVMVMQEAALAITPC